MFYVPRVFHCLVLLLKSGRWDGRGSRKCPLHILLESKA